jgi:hypothetical protein
MPCEITAGYAIDCRDSIGGIDAIYLIENSALYDASGVSRVTYASGVVTALGKDTGKKFYKFEVPRATAMASNNITASTENGTIFYTHMVSFPINSRSATTRNIINTLAKNRVTIVTKNMDGSYNMFGQGFGLFLDTAEGGSGTALGDRSGYQLSFSSQEADDFLVVPSNIALTMETVGA